MSVLNGTDLANFEDRFWSWTCVHLSITCVRVRKECSVGKTLQGEEVGNQAKFVLGACLIQVALGSQPGVYTQCTCEVHRWRLTDIGVQEARLF